MIPNVANHILVLLLDEDEILIQLVLDLFLCPETRVPKGQRSAADFWSDKLGFDWKKRSPQTARCSIDP